MTDAQIIANLLSNPVKALIESGFSFITKTRMYFLFLRTSGARLTYPIKLRLREYVVKTERLLQRLIEMGDCYGRCPFSGNQKL